MWPFRRFGLLSVIYIIVGLFVASNENYLDNVNSVREVISAILAVLLWPLVLIGVDFHVSLDAVITLR
jgi:hypothetical protein